MPTTTTTASESAYSTVSISYNSLRPAPRRLHLTPTHLVIQKSTPQDLDNESTRPVHGSDTEEELEMGDEKRRIVLNRQDDGWLGVSLRGGWEYGLPLIVTRVNSEEARGLVRRGDAVLEINGLRLRKHKHDDCLQILNSAGPRVELVVKYYPNTKPYLANTTGGDLMSDSDDYYYETERAVPLTFALLTRYLKSTDQLRVNSFQVTDCTLNTTSGVIYPSSTHSLTYWIKSISDAITILNSNQLKILSSPPSLVLNYSNWIWTGLQSPSEPINWSPKVLTITNDYLLYADYPPLVHSGEESEQRVPITCSLLRILNASECLDERPHCFVLQLALEGKPFPPKKPASYYCSTETRIELNKIESAWGRAVVEGVKLKKVCTFPVWWSGKPCQLELSTTTSSFKLFKATTAPTPCTPLWTRHFSTLVSSTDDSRTKLTLKFQNGEQETMECSELHRLLFSIHSWLLARVVVAVV